MFTITNCVRIAVAQVGIIVSSVLAAGVTGKILEGLELPAPTQFLVNYGFLLLSLPLVWISWVAWCRVRKEISEETKSMAFLCGLMLVVVLLIFGGYGVMKPWLGITWGIGKAQMENER